MERDFFYLVDKYGVEGARKKFEKICRDLFGKMYSNTYAVEVNQGDGGIDVFVGNFNQEIKVIQCKFFIDGIKDSQKSNIRESFKTAISSNKYNMKEWILCIPRNLDLEQHKWWAKWKDKHEEDDDVIIKLVDGDKLLLLMKHYGIYDEYFNTVRLDKDLIQDIIKNSEDRDNILFDKFNNEIRNYVKYFINHDFSIVPTPCNLVYKLNQIIDEWQMPDKGFENKKLEKCRIDIISDMKQLTFFLESPIYFRAHHNPNFMMPNKDPERENFKFMQKGTFELRQNIVRSYEKMFTVKK